MIGQIGGFTFGLWLKSDAFSHYRATEAFLERSNDIAIKNIHCGGDQTPRVGG